MFFKKNILVTLCVVALPCVHSAQSNASQTSIEAIVETLGSLEDADVNLEVLYETLSNYAQNPININAAGDDDLLQLRLLNEFQVQALHEYIAQYGEMLTPYELQYVPGFTPELMQQLLPFVCTIVSPKQEPRSLKRMLANGTHELLARGKQVVEKQQGYSPATDSLLQVRPNARYTGSPQALYGRYRYHYKNNLQWGITADKDAGEDFFAGSNPHGFDFYSAHLQVSNIGVLKNFVLGDFYAQFGQGLALWQGSGFGKSADAMGVAKRGAGIKAYTGADENNFFRGAAAAVGLGRWTISTFVSRHRRDANVDSTGVFSSQYTTGLHNTQKTIHDKDALQETAVGLNVAHKFKYVQVGATGLWHSFDGDYQRNVQPYNVLELNRNSNVNVSARVR
ncbi:hypothetical protein AGMMS4956_20630 [Bacteroidia bacterium]|nr:hypothetical protein AGMMS4956_20630 [Bacteroidia bacterium]